MFNLASSTVSTHIYLNHIWNPILRSRADQLHNSKNLSDDNRSNKVNKVHYVLYFPPAFQICPKANKEKSTEFWESLGVVGQW